MLGVIVVILKWNIAYYLKFRVKYPPRVYNIENTARFAVVSYRLWSIKGDKMHNWQVKYPPKVYKYRTHCALCGC